ncbi:glutamate racemase [Flammeovirgaceae bacterium SG7u.111]|nr:glutamate racemase [Flammeovirgaceae bacterium SG7u.132]WPO36216.1 glutamate racemase [Flammeovirgaceae bacterium SG7u.111]
MCKYLLENMSLENSEKQNTPIGIFDSGVGGLSVWREIRRILPHENTIYFADSANCPYGPQPTASIIAHSEKVVNFLLEKKCKLIVVACNTATSAAIKYLREKYPIQFVGMEPAIKPAALSTQTGKIGVLATEGTIKGQHFINTKEKFARGVEVLETIGTGLVELVESGEWNTEKGNKLVGSYVNPMIDFGADRIVLGCTHYPFLKELIAEIVGEKAKILNPAPAVAKRVHSVLKEQNILSRAYTKPSHEFYGSGSLESLKKLVSLLEIEPFSFPNKNGN